MAVMGSSRIWVKFGSNGAFKKAAIVASQAMALAAAGARGGGGDVVPPPDRGEARDSRGACHCMMPPCPRRRLTRYSRFLVSAPSEKGVPREWGGMVE